MIKTKCNQIKKSKDFQLINENGSKRALIKG
jgi:RNase P protein component